MMMDPTFSTAAEEPSTFLNAMDYTNMQQDWLFTNDQSVPYYDQRTPISSEQSDLGWPQNASESAQQGLPSHGVYPLDDRGAPSTLDLSWPTLPALSAADHTSSSWALTPEHSHSDMQMQTKCGDYSLPAPAKSRTSVRKISLPDGRVKPPTIRSRLSYEARLILNQWFDNHRNDPYLEKCEAEDLAQATDLTVRQVRTYFANARARKLPPTPVTVSSGRGRSPVQRDTATDAIEGADCTHEQCQQWGVEGRPPHTPKDQSPMERFLSGSPEDEGISEDLIKAAAENLHGRRRSSLNKSARNINKRFRRAQRMTEAPSEYGAASRAGSVSSQTSAKSAVPRGPRRGRKRQPENLRLPQTMAIIRAPNDSRKIYQCTFCTQDFSHKYDWRRHEESVHCPQQEWICMPDNIAVVQSLAGTSHCAFCGDANPSAAHLESHNCTSCLAAPRSHRVFTRKDKLLQHIGQVHKQSATPQHLSNWCRPIEREVTYWCGICGVHLPTWQERVDHIAGHFLQGQDMRFWRGEPGHVHAGLNAVSPFTQPVPTAVGNGFPFATGSPVEHSPRQAFPYTCAIGCGEQFAHFGDAIFHERQIHQVYKERPDISTEPIAASTTPSYPPPMLMSIPPTPILPSTLSGTTVSSMISQYSTTNGYDSAYATSTWPGTLDINLLSTAGFDRRMTAPALSDYSYSGSATHSASCSPEMPRYNSLPTEGSGYAYFHE